MVGVFADVDGDAASLHHITSWMPRMIVMATAAIVKMFKCSAAVIFLVHYQHDGIGDDKEGGGL